MFSHFFIRRPIFASVLSIVIVLAGVVAILSLPVALTDTIVPDFPLTNKSFNQSYAGNDL